MEYNKKTDGFIVAVIAALVLVATPFIIAFDRGKGLVRKIFRDHKDR